MWVEALEAYHQAQKALGKRASSLKRSKGLGKVLWGLVKAHGLDDLRTVLVWWSTSSHKRARYLRAEDYGLKTIKRNWDEYLELATEPPSTAPDDGWEFPEDIDNAHWGREKHG